MPSEPSPATPSDAREVTGGQGVAGSNPPVPTGSDNFSNIPLPHQEPAKEPSPCEIALPQARADHVSRRPTRAFVNPAEPGEAGQPRGQRLLSHLGPARRARQLRTGGHGFTRRGVASRPQAQRTVLPGHGCHRGGAVPVSSEPLVGRHIVVTAGAPFGKPSAPVA